MATTSSLPSRYDMIPPGASTDPLDGEAYPDTLLVNYNDFEITQPAILLPPNDRFIAAPYIMCYSSDTYGTPYYDDIVLNINGVANISMLYNFESIKFPVKSDLIAFMTRNK